MRHKAEIPRFGGDGGIAPYLKKLRDGGDTTGSQPNTLPGTMGNNATQAMQQAQALYGIPGPQMSMLPQSMFPSQPLAALYNAVTAARQPQQFQQPVVNSNFQLGYRNLP